MRRLAHKDPPLYSGLGYQVLHRPYHKWIKEYTSEEEVCIQQMWDVVLSNCADLSSDEYLYRICSFRTKEHQTLHRASNFWHHWML